MDGSRGNFITENSGKMFPGAQFAYGPPVENGFYYDVELSHRIAPEDFEKIEAEMKKEIKVDNRPGIGMLCPCPTISIPTC